MKRLPKSFYEQGVTDLAIALLGKTIVTNLDGALTSGIIVETEAYRGADDKGCHAYRHGKTPKTATMFAKPGHAYIYICYGMHPMLNIVTNDENNGDAVLIRAIEPIKGNDRMGERRSSPKGKYDVTNGPGKLAVALGINKSMDATILYHKNSNIWIEDKGLIIPDQNIYRGPRVGMSSFVAECSHWPWRYYIKDNPWVSKPKHVDYSGKW
jgi:DNA-3-methyladenine glycosylase